MKEGTLTLIQSFIYSNISEFLLVLGTALGAECTSVNKSLKTLVFMELTFLVRQTEMIQ